VVRVTEEQGAELETQLGCVIPITRIDPSRVMVEPDDEYFYVMRDSGYDTRLRP